MPRYLNETNKKKLHPDSDNYIQQFVTTERITLVSIAKIN